MSPSLPRTLLPRFSSASPRLARLPLPQRCSFTAKPARREETGKDSFKGQLYQSTHDRIQRERADQERFVQLREMEKGRGSSSTLVVPLTLIVGALGGWYVGSQNQHSPDTQSTKPLAGFPPPQHDTSPATLQAAWAEFRDIVGQEHVRTDETVRRAHAGSDWSSHNPAASDVPFCVVRPVSTDEVAQIMRVCHRRRIPVAAYSGGTSLEGHFASLPGGVCVDFARMDQIVALHPDDLDVVVQPGVGWEELNDHLAPHGLFFPPDPAPGAQIGGMVATSCSGTNAYRHGTMKEWVVGVTAVLADGTVVHTRQRPRKSSAGYDLTRLLVGSEGTLALVTQVTLKVTPAPACTRVAVCSFPSLRTAADAARRVVGAGVPVAALELLDDVQMKCINAAGSSATTRSWPEQPTLFFKFGGSPALIAEQVDTVRALARQAGARTFEFARSDAEAADLWAARKGALWAVMGQGRPADRVWTTDVAVPMSRLADLLELTRADLDASGLTASMVAHAGDGNFHAVILYADDAGAERAAVEQVVARLATRAVEMEGTVSGEHGVGLVKRDYLVQELGGDAVDLMRKIKLAFDPLCILNCDKVVRVMPSA